VALRLTRHPVLPLPDAADPGPAPREPGAEPADLLVDERLGIVTGLVAMTFEPPMPAALTTVQALGCDISRVGPWRNDPVGGGCGFGDFGAARRAAVGELVERYCGNIVRPELLTHASYEDLSAAGEHAVDPQTLVLFSAHQYGSAGFPFHPFGRDLPVHWVRGRSLTRDIPAWLPASLVYVNWYASGYADGPPVNGASYAGIATGPSLAESVTAGLYESIERHATMVWWLNRQPLPGVRPSPAVLAAWPESANGPLRGRLIQLDNEFGVPVLAGVVEDTERDMLTIGFAARHDPAQAALKAWAEALMLQRTSADLAREDNAYTATVAGGRLPEQGLKPWRADRRYLDDYRADFRDVVSLICQTQVHLDPRAAPGLPAVRAAVEARGHEIFYADITTPDVAATGLRVTRTLVPGLIGNFPAAFPFLGQGEAAASAVRLGWRSTPLPEAELTTLPIPHA
jgi:ribosomal protein S12 methylthiotransferase accessory factor